MLAGISFAARVAACLLALAALTGCGDDEADQRKAFIQFLQTRIVNKPGVHVPHLTAEESKSFGDYARHYAVIADFNGNLDRLVSKPLAQALHAAMPRSIEDAVGRRAELAAAGETLAKIRVALDQQLAAADAARAALKQPPDLKPVYDAAYDRDVTQPAKVFVEVFPETDAATKSVLALIDFIAEHRAQIKLQGSLIQTSDPGLQRPLQTLLEAVRTKEGAINDARRRFNALVNG